MSRILHTLADEIHMLRMDCLTLLGKSVLPSGIWHRGSSKKASDKRLLLTFDDGPCPNTTPRLLELLESENIKASFFLLGSQAAKHPEIVKQIADAGHLIGNHTYNHHFLPSLSVKQIEEEIALTNLRIAEAAGFEPKLFRPPFGLIDKRGADCLKEREMTPVYWGAVAEDWMPIGAHRVTARLMRRLSDGNLLVLHEGKAIARQTLEATKQIIRRGHERGYRFDLIG